MPLWFLFFALDFFVTFVSFVVRPNVKPPRGR